MPTKEREPRRGGTEEEGRAVWQYWEKILGELVKVKRKSWNALEARLGKEFSLEPVCT